MAHCHQVHHADLDVDLTTGIRFHPIEIMLSLLYKAAIVLALGIDPWTVLLFEAVLNASAVFTHGNVALPERLDVILRWVVCTPDMHRVHHSTERAETDSNYGFFLSVWDRLCRTMRHAPAKGQLGVELGLPRYRDPGELGLGALLVMPFRRLRRGAAVTGSSSRRPLPRRPPPGRDRHRDHPRGTRPLAGGRRLRPGSAPGALTRRTAGRIPAPR